MIDPNTVKPVYNGHPWDPQKVAVVYWWLLFEVFQSKLVLKLAWQDLVWLLLTGGHCPEVAVVQRRP
jgi:hypothetical protein